MCRLKTDVIKALYANNCEKVLILEDKLKQIPEGTLNHTVISQQLNDAQFNVERMKKHL